MIKNSRGTIYYGMHFYPGVAEYREPGKEPYRVFLNEDTLRRMDPTFAGRPIFVDHVDGVDENIDELRKEADGWVIESFFNAADGKHWVKFVVVSERGERAIGQHMRLSNAYVPTAMGSGGLWNGVDYQKEITNGEFEHLAIVKNPRYEESRIMTPEEFKQYNEQQLAELKRLSNSQDKGATEMKFNLFKKAKVENQADIEGMSVVLPKSKREMTLEALVNEADDMEEKKKANAVPADMGHVVKLHDGSMCNVGELVEKHKAMCDALSGVKKDEMETESDVSTESSEVDSESSPEMANEEDDAEEKKKAADDEKKKNSADAAKKTEAKKKADALKNANQRNAVEETHVIQFSSDQVARGKSRYGSK